MFCLFSLFALCGFCKKTLQKYCFLRTYANPYLLKYEFSTIFVKYSTFAFLRCCSPYAHLDSP